MRNRLAIQEALQALELAQLHLVDGLCEARKPTGYEARNRISIDEHRGMRGFAAFEDNAHVLHPAAFR